MDSDIIHTNNGWYSKSFADAFTSMHNKVLNDMCYRELNNGNELHEERQKRNENNLKWAYIKVANTEKMEWVDNVTNKAYKKDGYNKTNIEIKKFKFIRWCTSMDL